MTLQRIRRQWPWIVLALAVVPAVWHLVDFESDTDPEYPLVIRPTFSPYPPAAYRLAEPGDTIDRVSLYLASAAVALAAAGWFQARRRGVAAGLWPAALALALGACWYASTPGPTFDGWHGLGWRTMFDPAAPAALRGGLLAAALGLGTLALASVKGAWPGRRELAGVGRKRGVLSLLVISGVLISLRQVNLSWLPGPVEYWPRWAFAWGIMAYTFALARALPPLSAGSRRGRLAWSGGIVAVAALVVVGGLWITWLHRPLGRFKAAVPGKIYISAMPTYRGLEVVQRRHGFKTIINLFPEHTDRRSPLLPDELRFVREHGLTYLLHPDNSDEGDAFLDRTLAVAQDPDAWPILVHCHGCMDRTPAWLGIYRYLVQGRPLDEVIREIEQHRGYRPKASVTLLYNHALARLAPERYAQDPTGQLLVRNAADSPTPYDERNKAGEPRATLTRREGRAVGERNEATERR